MSTTPTSPNGHEPDSGNGARPDRRGANGNPVFRRQLRIRRIEPCKDNSREDDKWYIRFGLGHPEEGKRFYFPNEKEAKNAARNYNDNWAGRPVIEQQITPEYLHECMQALPVVMEIREARPHRTMRQIAEDDLERFRDEDDEPAFREMFEARITEAKTRGLGEDLVNHLKSFRFPFPEEKLPAPDDRRGLRRFVQSIREWALDQRDQVTGEKWSWNTLANWFNTLNGFINHAVDTCLTRHFVNPLSRAFRNFKAKYFPGVIPLDKAPVFMTFLLRWQPRLLIPFVLALLGGIRIKEVGRLVWGDIKGLDRRGKGMIVLRAGLTKKKKHREIHEKHQRGLFRVLRAHRHLFGKPDERIVPIKSWMNQITKGWRLLFGEEWDDNWLRHTLASAMLAAKGMETTCKVIGHEFARTSQTLLDHYVEFMEDKDAQAYLDIAPQPVTPELLARFARLSYTAWIRPEASLTTWPNFAQGCAHTLQTRGEDFARDLQLLRPIFLEAEGRELTITVIGEDGVVTERTVTCDSAEQAATRRHFGRVAAWTGLGVIDPETGVTRHYAKNYGPFFGQRPFRLENPGQLVAEMKRDGFYPAQVASQLGISVTLVLRYRRKGVLIPESHARALGVLMPSLHFVEAPYPGGMMGRIMRGDMPDSSG